MDADTAAALRRLLAAQEIAALGTLRAGRAAGSATAAEPFVSMVPVAWRADGAALIHVSALSPHTRDLRTHPAVSLMLMAPRTPGDDPQALPRVTLQAEARELAAGSDAAAAAAAVYCARFPRAGQTFALADFTLFALAPQSARFVAGFGRAHALTAADWARLVNAA